MSSSYRFSIADRRSRNFAILFSYSSSSLGIFRSARVAGMYGVGLGNGEYGAGDDNPLTGVISLILLVKRVSSTFDGSEIRNRREESRCCY